MLGKHAGIAGISGCPTFSFHGILEGAKAHAGEAL
jgi:hypothetical protein